MSTRAGKSDSNSGNITQRDSDSPWFRKLDEQTLAIGGEWRIADLNEIEAGLTGQDLGAIERVDGSKLTEIDTAAAMTLFRFLCISDVSKDHVQWEQFSDRPRQVLELTIQSVEDSCSVLGLEMESTLERIGKTAHTVYAEVRSLCEFVGRVAVEFVSVARNPKRFRLKETVTQLQNTGIDAAGICILVTFLIGIVLAYLTGVQIERYGINILIVDGVSLAMTRELSPILVAIIVAGRSGSAFTAQLGTMKLNEEVDAIQTMGLSHYQVLVLPRITALVLVMPLLVFLGDIAGIFGGMLAADVRLGVGSNTFLERLQTVLPLKSVFVGMIKAPVFAFFIATIGCRLGLQADNNAASVGRSTTSTVVQSIVAVILLNAGFAVLFSELGI